MSLTEKLADISNPINDEFIGVVMLAGLPKRYDPMVIALEGSGVKIRSDLIKNKLLQEDGKREVDNRRQPEDATFMANFKGRFYRKK